ncbi:MAG TPA: hypothetical protein VGV15_03570 [Terriglobales bacterium]|nr:hypothetical protein [Terriglobales bacterium]
MFRNGKTASIMVIPYPVDANSKPEAIPGSPSKCNCGIIQLDITVQNPSISVTKACTTALTPGTTNTSCDAGPEGSNVTYTVGITNGSNFGDIVVDQVCDSVYGAVFQAGSFSGPACKTASSIPPANTTCTALDIAAGATQSCTFTVPQGEDATVTDTVEVNGHGAVSGTPFPASDSNSVTVTSSDAPSTATITKGYNGTLAACATVRYGVDVANTSGFDENLTLNSLNDSAFGDVTTVQGNVKATTCTIPAGGVSLPVGGADFKCTFDAQFCGGVDANGCIQNTDTLSGNFTADEAADKVTVTANTLTVKECLTATVTSQ